MHNQIFERLRILDAILNQTLIDLYNSHFIRKAKNENLKLIVNENVRPCFFSGDIETKGRVVTISLNPSYTPQITEEEQANKNFDEWYEFCRFRFEQYKSDSAVHNVFKNLFKVIAPRESWKNSDRRHYLQTHLLNLDWCFYYSKQFPSNFNKIPQILRDNISETWDRNLNWLIEISEPRYIFAHGRAIQNWIIQNTTKLEIAIKMENSRHQSCCLFEGKFANTKIPVYYLEHFINVVNETETLENINRFVNRLKT